MVPRGEIEYHSQPLRGAFRSDAPSPNVRLQAGELTDGVGISFSCNGTGVRRRCTVMLLQVNKPVCGKSFWAQQNL